ncbi:methylated-DNA--[protein]-cysteine S-methyltransferase [Pseudonocardiaceae bacterium YIM PH 21723]|nr:methylated-DNA--[protein]-cysteine S-methyltransferase [Pseudonocardiaceae bacterium YIM PH 21723]
MNTTELRFHTPLAGSPHFTLVQTPVGELTLTGDGEHLTGIYMGPDHRHRPPQAEDWIRADDEFTEVRRQLDAYFAGELREFDLPLAPRGTEFQRAVWQGLTTIPFGETLSYGELAQQLGRPGSARAVGMANGRNPISIVVPCHRVIGANGLLTGYGGGLQHKEILLKLERG